MKWCSNILLGKGAKLHVFKLTIKALAMLGQTAIKIEPRFIVNNFLVFV